jgi:hypothetical protein
MRLARQLEPAIDQRAAEPVLPHVGRDACVQFADQHAMLAPRQRLSHHTAAYELHPLALLFGQSQELVRRK